MLAVTLLVSSDSFSRDSFAQLGPPAPPAPHALVPPDVAAPQADQPAPTFPSELFPFSPPSVTSGTWTVLNDQPFNHTPVFYPDGEFLLTDGTVLVQDGNLTDVAWWKLTPDNFGSYINGTWSQVASPGPCPNGYPGASADTVYSPLYYASAVLPDGRFVMIGGEYNYNYNYAGHGAEVWTNQGAIYDPIGNSWTCIAAPTGWNQIGDAESVVLPSGTFMMADPLSSQDVTLNTGTNPPTFNAPFTPTGKSADKSGYNNEEGWTLLPDGSVFTLEVWNTNDATETPALTYNSGTQAWSSAGIAPDALVLISKGTVNYFEVGPAVLRPDGTIFASGATGFNDIYDIGGASWSSGPSFPTFTSSYSNGGCNAVGLVEQYAEADAPAALLPDGNVLLAPGPVDSQSTCEWIPPTVFFEFDGTSLTQVNSSTYAAQVPSYNGRLLVLPTGQVMYTNDYDYVELYTPSGSPNSSWAPTISMSPSSVTPGVANYSLSGKQLNGLSQANYYGDDFQAATNYPLVRITNNGTGHVFYARTHSHSTMAVATGNTTVSTQFDVPAGIEAGASSLVVVANGIPSQPVSVNVLSVATPTATATATATPTASATATATSTIGTPTATATGTATATSTATKTATSTATATSSATKTATSTATVTVTSTATATATRTATSTATPTATATATSTATATAGATKTPTSTATATATSSPTPTSTTTSTQTATGTAIATSTMTATATSTATPTATATSTIGTPTATATATETQTATPTSTATATKTATSTATSTATVTATPTATPTPAAGTVSVSPNPVNFGTKNKVNKISKAKKVTIRNTSLKSSKLSVTITGETAGAPFAVKTQCIKPLAPGKSCKALVTFTAPNTTPQNGMLTVNDNASGAPQMIPLSGTGM